MWPRRFFSNSTTVSHRRSMILGSKCCSIQHPDPYLFDADPSSHTGWWARCTCGPSSGRTRSPRCGSGCFPGGGGGTPVPHWSKRDCKTSRPHIPSSTFQPDCVSLRDEKEFEVQLKDCLQYFLNDKWGGIENHPCWIKHRHASYSPEWNPDPCNWSYPNQQLLTAALEKIHLAFGESFVLPLIPIKDFSFIPSFTFKGNIKFI